MSGFMQGNPGRQAITNQTATSIGTAGKPIRLFDAAIVSGGTAATVKLYNGTAASGSDFLQLDGVINKSTFWGSDNGLLFPNGCWAAVDSNTTNLLVSYYQEL